MEIYLDNAATSWPKPESVYTAVEDFMRFTGTSSGRGAYRKALRADALVFETRNLLAELFGVPDPAQIVFTSNATEALNTALKGFLKKGDRVVTTSMEHNSVWRCLKTLEEERGITIAVVACDAAGRLDPEAVGEALEQPTDLVVMTHASNVTGTIMPVAEVGAMTREKGVPLLVDSAQTAGVLPIDVEEQQIDLLAFTGHKSLFGPPGTGGLYVRKGLNITPLKEGGTGSDSLLERQPEHMPDRLEAGTQNVPGIVGLGAGIQFIQNETRSRIREEEVRLTQYLLDSMNTVSEITVYGPPAAEERVGVVSFNIEGVPSDRVAAMLDTDFGILVRAGIHCCPCGHRTIGTLETGAVRVGLGHFNSERDIDYLVYCLREIKQKAG